MAVNQRRRLLSTAAVLAACLAGTGAVASAAHAAAFGFTSSGGFYTVDTGAALVFKINQSNGDLTSLKFNGTELQNLSRFSHVESGLGSGTSVTARQTGNLIVITETATNFYGSGTLIQYLVARSRDKLGRAACRHRP